MLELFQLEQLAAFAQYGTLSKAAEALHLSQPSLTRSMQKLEAEFGVTLFQRTKNKLSFNENGELAADYAKRILDQTKDMLDLVRARDRMSHTLSFGTCAPIPILTLLQNAAREYSNMTVSSELKENDDLLRGAGGGGLSGGHPSFFCRRMRACTGRNAAPSPWPLPSLWGILWRTGRVCL